MAAEININSNIIRWAITRAGFKLPEFAIKFPKVLEWVEKGKSPTIKELQEFSQKVHLPFGYLLLDTPPIENLPIPFFRTGTEVKSDVSINVHDTVIMLQRRQDWLVNYLIDNDFPELEFVGKYGVNANYKQIVKDIRKTLNLENYWASKFGKWEDTLDHLTKSIEEIGIIVVFNSIVENNTHRAIEVDECRGFVLVNPYAPFMFVNSADGKAAQMFTIIHELAHIWTGKSAGFDFRNLQPANNPIEKLCDKVAAEFLVPEDSFNKEWQKTQDLKSLSRIFKVSPIVIGRRALDLGKITKKAFFAFYNDYRTAVQHQKDNQSGGGDFYATQKKRLSMRYVGFINQAVKNNSLLYRDAYKLTGLKGATFENFLNNHLH
jgi:Zn-dependent peptidase ImmA (M78 family)